MKLVTLMLSLVLATSLLAGCSEVKRKVEETGRGVTEHALSKGFGAAQDAGDTAVNKGADAATGDKQSQDRNALKGNDDSDKDK